MSGEPTITSTVEQVTPECAAAYLSTSTGNRRLSPSQIRIYTELMNSGRWQLCGDALQFDWDGHLLDGHNRLTACTKTVAESVPFLVLRGLPPESRDAIDLGRKRSLADLLHLGGYPQAQNLSATLLWEWKARHEALLARGAYPAQQHAELQAIAAEIADPMLEAVRDTNAYLRQHRTWLPPALAAWLLYKLRTLDVERADAFFTQLAGGQHLAAGDPIYTLREWLSTDPTQRTPPPAAVHAGVICLFVCKAWNAYVRAEPLPRLRYQLGEKFPGFRRPYAEGDAA